MEYVEVEGVQFPMVGLGTFPMKGEQLESSLLFSEKVGYGLIDTAYKYLNEDIIGHFLQHKVSRNSIIVQSKFSVTQLTHKSILGFRFSFKTIDDAINGSIQRLKRDKLDVYLLHSPSKGFENYWGDLLRFKAEGKARIVGVCRFDEQQLRVIKEKYGDYPSINQIEIHPFYTNKRLISFCKDNGIAVEARSIFTHGDALNELIYNDSLIHIASEYNKTVPQILLRWIVQQGLIAIVKSSTEAHLIDNINVFDFSLTSKEMKVIDGFNNDKSFGFVSTHLKYFHANN